MTPLIALLLGAVQGATEFLPVSSSGHLSLLQAWLGVDPATAGHRFNITAHAGTLTAVVWVYRRDVGSLLRAAMRPTQASDERRYLGMMLIASVPLAVVLLPGVEALVIAMESQVRLIGVALWVTAALLFVGFRRDRGDADPQTPPGPWQAVLIGVAQLLAVVPGISRSGATIAAGVGSGLEPSAAARFSFLISLIAIGAASAREAVVVARQPAAIDPLPLAIGFVTSLIVGLACLRALLYLVDRGKVGVFIVYLLVVGGLAIAL